MNLTPTFLNFWTGSLALQLSWHHSKKPQSCATTKIFLHHGKIDSHLLMMSYSRTCYKMLIIWQIFISLSFDMVVKKNYVWSCPTWGGGYFGHIYLRCFKPYGGVQWQETRINCWQELSLLYTQKKKCLL